MDKALWMSEKIPGADNGGEFANEKYKEMNEKLNIEVCHTAGESTWSNGMVECHNAVLEECLGKVIRRLH